MFQIENGREHFFQWDANQRLIVNDPSISEVHFYNGTEDNALVCEVYEKDNRRVVNVPNILLIDSWVIHAYAYLNDYTKVEERFKVFARAKPANYVYTETEVLNYNTLADRIDNVNNNIGASVEDYLQKHPVEVDLSNYALKSEIPTNVSAFANDAGYLTDHQSLTNYYTKTEVDALTSDFITSIPAEYITESELDAKGYITEQQDLSAYALKSEIPSLDGYAKTADLSVYALKSEIPDVSAYQTEAQVIALIQSNMPASGDEVSY